MGETAIKIENIGKRYALGASKRRYESIAEHLTDGIRRLFSPNKQVNAGEKTFWALQDICLEINKGEMVGIIGRNGSGKSTLLKILSRITEPTTGRALVNGKLCSLLEVGTGFHNELTGRDNIYLSGAVLGMKKTEIDHKFDAIVEFSEIGKFIDTPVKHYSSGMYVRLGFAVAAHMEPDILIVDEVLAVGDGRFQQKCMANLQDVERHGQTVIFVSHDVAAVTRLCKRAILLESGRVVRDGPAHEVVGEYLCGLDRKRPCQEWLDPATAPGNEIVRMCAFRTRTEEGVVADAVNISRPVGVEIEFEVLMPGHILVPSFGIRNEGGVIVFVARDRDPAWLRRPRPVGRFVSTAWIPGNLLTEGSFIVGGGLITEAPFREHCDVSEAVMIHVIQGGEGETARGDYTGTWAGTIRPLLKWTTTYKGVSSE